MLVPFAGLEVSDVLNRKSSPSVLHVPLALIAGWVLPGAGHLLLGHRGRGLVFLVTIAATFWTGVAVGGVRATVDPETRRLWFVAQLGAGSHALTAWAGHELWQPPAPQSSRADLNLPVPRHWRLLDIAVHYTGVAGLLNVLVLLDLVARGEAIRLGTAPPGAGGGT